MRMRPEQLEALRECLHVSNGKAAACLSDLIGQAIELKIPDLRLMPLSECKKFLDARYAGWVASVRMGFDGTIAGDAFLLLDDDSAKTLVHAVFGGTEIDELSVSDEDALSELANILLNGYLGTLSNLLRSTLTYELPEFKRDIGSHLVDLGPDDQSGAVVLALNTAMRVAKGEFDVSILLLMGVASISNLEHAIDKLLQSASGELV